MNYLVTGAAGFIGSACATFLMGGGTSCISAADHSILCFESYKT